MKKLIPVAAVLVAFSLVAIVGCSQNAESPKASNSTSSAKSLDGSKYLLAIEPAGAADVITARKEAKDTDDVVVVGRIGGSENPWIQGRAAFTIVDRSLKACSDIPGDTCDKPWDYCCQTAELPTATALVKFVDENGKPVSADARELLKVKELQTVIVRGKAQRDDSGNLTVLASGVYVRN